MNPALVGGEPEWLNSTGNGSLWALPLTAVGVGPRRAEVGEQVQFALNGDQLRLSAATANWTMAQVPGSRAVVEPQGGKYAVPCGTDTPLTLQLAGYEVEIPPAAWVVPAADGCWSAVVYVHGEPPLLSAPLLSSVYTVFRYGGVPQIGFAALSDAARGVKAQRITPGREQVDGEEPLPSPTVSIPGHSVLPSAGADSGAGRRGVSAAAVVAAAACLLV
jgi:hypothetical protein